MWCLKTVTTCCVVFEIQRMYKWRVLVVLKTDTGALYLCIFVQTESYEYVYI